MAIRFSCPKCSQPFEADLEDAGSKIECPCGARLRIPSPKSAAKPASNPAAKPTAQTQPPKPAPKKLAPAGNPQAGAAVPKPKLRPKLKPASSPHSPSTQAGSPKPKLKPVAKSQGQSDSRPKLKPVTSKVAVAPVGVTTASKPKLTAKTAQPIVPQPAAKEPAPQPASPATPIGIIPTGQAPATPKVNAVSPVPVQPAGIRVAPSPAAAPVIADVSAPATTKSSSPFDFGGDSNGGDQEPKKKSSSGRRRKKKNNSTGWILVGGATVVVLGAVGFFLYSKDQQAKRLAERNAENAKIAAERAAVADNLNDSTKVADAKPEVASSAPPAARESLAAVQEAPAEQMSPVQNNDADDEEDPPANVEPMTANRAQPMMEMPITAEGFAGDVQKFGQNPYNEALHQTILAKPFSEAMTELAEQSDELKAKYLLLRLRYFIGDKDSVAPLAKIPFKSVVAAAETTFWETRINRSELDFHAAENIEQNELHNTLRIYGSSEDEPAARIEMIRTQVILFQAEGSGEYFAVNLGRHLYTDDLQRLDHREILLSAPKGLDVPRIASSEDEMNEWKAPNFRFPVWANEHASDQIKEHFGVTAPGSKDWPIETFTADGKLVRDPADMQRRVLD